MRRNTLDANFLDQAKVLLEEARAGRPKVGWLERLLLLLCRAKARPQRIGTSYKELRVFANMSDIEQAKEWLRRARDPIYSYRRHRGPEVYYVRQYLARAGLTPDDIGTSKAELVRLASWRNS